MRFFLRLPAATIATAFFVSAGLPQTLQAAAGLASTKVAVFAPGGDVNGDGKFQAGDTLLYTVTVNNSGDVDLTGVTFNDIIDPNTTLGAVNISPLARDDAYTTVANTLLEVGVTHGAYPAAQVAGNVIGNDSEFLGDTFTLKKLQAVNFSGGTATATSAQGGSVTMNASGNFTYLPAAGFTGTDTFTYTITDKGLDGTAGNADDTTGDGTVTITVGTQKVWYVDNSYAGVNGASDGRSTRPFTSITATNLNGPGGVGDVDGSNDIIFLSTGTGSAYTGGIALEASQTLQGQGTALVVGGFTLVSAGSSPTISNPGGVAVALSTGNVLRGFTAGSAATSVGGTSFGTLDVLNVTINNTTGGALSLTTGAFASGSSFNNITSTGGNNSIALTGVTGSGTIGLGGGALSGASGAEFFVSGGNTSLTYSGNITNSSGRSVDISTHSGDITLSGTLTDTGSGMSITNNTSGTITFSGSSKTLTTGSSTAVTFTGNGASLQLTGGPLVITTTSGAGINASGNTGTLAITGTSNTLSSTTGTALTVSTSPIAAAGLTFQSVSANGAASGIVMNTTGASGTLTVTGDGSTSVGGNNSGGTIQNTTSHGISLINTQSPSFTNMNIQTTAGSGVFGTAVTNFTFKNGKINNSGTALFVTETSNIAFNTTTAGTENNLSGTVVITGNTLTNAYYHGVDIFNFNGTIADANISTNTITSSTSTATTKGTGIRLVAFGSSSTIAHVTKATIDTNTITNFVSANGILASSGNGNAGGTAGTFGTSVANPIAITNNILNGGAAKFGAFGMAATVNGKGTAFFNIHNNSVSNSLGTAISIGSFGFATSNVVVTKNTIVANNNVGAQGIGAGTSQTFGATDTPTLNIRIGDGTAPNANNISQTDGNGILVTARDSTGKVNARILRNTVATPLGGLREGIRVDAGNSISVDDEVNLEISNNTSSGSTSGANIAAGIGLRKQGTAATINDFKIVGTSATSTPNVEGYVNGQNTSASGNFGVGGTDLISAMSGFSSGTTMSFLMFSPAEPESVDVAPPDSTEAAIAWTEALRLRSVSSTPVPPVQAVSSQPAAVIEDAPQSPSPARDTALAPAALTQAQLDTIVAAARTRWEATGLSTEQLAALDKVTFSVTDLNGWYLGEAFGKTVRLDINAGGNDWFIDTTPLDDSEFADASVTGLKSKASTLASTRVDLLTTVLHEMGHSIGLCDTYSKLQRSSLMYGLLNKGERRLPQTGEAAGAVPHEHLTPHFAVGPVVIGGLPIGKNVQIQLTAQINTNNTSATISNQGTSSSTQTGPVLTDDPNVAGAANPTVTQIDLPDVTVAVSPASRLEDSGSALTYTFTRQGFTSAAITVNFSITGTASSATSDFSVQQPSGSFAAGVGTVIIPIGQSSVAISILPLSDTTVEPDETVITTVTSGTGYDIGTPSTATGTITNDDADIAVTVAPASVTENGGSALTYTLTRTGYNAIAVTANFTVGGTATLGGSAPANDFTTTGFSTSTGSINFAIGDLTKTLTVTPVGDTIDENDETVVLTMATGTGYNVTGSPATGTIADDDPPPTVSIAAPSSVTEGNAGTTNLSFTVSLSSASAKTITVNYATANGTATFASGDYDAASGTLTFAPGDLTKTVNVTVNGDTLNEANETLTVTLSGPANATLGTAVATGTINNDDPVPTLAINDVTLAEGNAGTTSFTFTVTLSPASGQTATVNYATADGTALAASDYAATSGTLTFAPGDLTKTVTVLVNGDTTSEGSENFFVNLTGPTNASIADSQGLGTITDDDLPQVSVATLAVGDNDAAEGGSNNGLFTFTRNSTVGALTASFQLDVSSTAIAGTDFTLTGATTFDNATGAGTIAFADTVGTATVTLTALTESPNAAEAAETARLNIVASPGVYFIGASPNATVTIAANSFIVTTTADSGTGSLRQAVDNANTIAGTDTVTFDATVFGVTPQVITLTTGEIPLTTNLTIQGPGAAMLTVSGGNSSRVFKSTAGTATLSGLLVTGGNGAGLGLGNGSGGGIFQQGGTLTLRNCVVTGNTASSSGGGIFCSDPGGSLTVINCTISGNTATAGGGGVWLFGAPSNVHKIVNSTISGNTAGTLGGGIGIVGTDTSIINSTVSGNNAGSHGGGVHVDGSGTLLVSSTTVTGNRCDVNPDASVGKGGGISLAAANTETLNNTIVAGNLSGASPSTTASDIDSSSAAQTINTASNNLIGNAGTAGGIANGTSGNLVGNAGSGTLAIASILNTTLADNGGSTFTHALIGTSAALNAGSGALLPVDSFDVDGDSNTAEAIDVDQRGATFLRSVGTTDIGAFELQKSVSIVADAASKNEGASGSTNYTFTVSRTGGTTGAVAMTYTVSGAAVNGTDFVGGTLPTGTATIANGSATTTVTIPVSGDILVEADEAFTVTLSSPDNGYAVVGSPATSTITNDDTATVTIAKLTDGTEGTANATFRLTQTALSSTDTVVNIAAGTGTAASGSDYTALASTITILAGQATATLTVTITDDRQVEGSETVIATLSSLGAHNSGIALGATLSDTASIADNDTATLGYTSGTSTALESGVTQTVGTTLTINAIGTGTIGLASNLTANLTTTGGTATGTGTDYTLPGSPAVTFLAGTYATGTATQNGTITVIDDRLVEGDETAALGLAIVTNIGTQVSLGGTTAHTLTLTDNDTAILGYTSGTSTALESGVTQNVGTTLTINAIGTGTIGLASNLTANFTATGGTASGSGTDYTLPGSPAVTFLAGTYATGTGAQNGAVTVIDDRQVEGNETAALGLAIVTNIGSQASLGGTTAHTLTLTDNDTAILGYTLATSTALESGVTQNVGTTLTINAIGTGSIGLASNLTANLTTTGGTATGGGTDYTLPGSPAVTFLAGTYATGTGAQNGAVTVIDDRQVEGDETAALGLAIVTNIGSQVSLGGTTAHTLTFTDNDTATLGFTLTGSAALEGVTATVGTTLTITPTGTGTIGLASNLTANVTSTAGTATGSGTDYTLPGSPAVTFLAGTYATGTGTQNASITVTDDRLLEGGETAALSLAIVTNIGTQASLGGSTAHTLTLTDNETATLGFSSATSTALEAAGLQNISTILTITSTGTGTVGLGSNLTANLTTTGGTATGAGTDYSLPASPAVTFLSSADYSSGSATQNGAITVIDDRSVEGSETAALGLSIVSNIGTQVSLGGTTAHTLTLTDNDTATLGFTTGSSTALENAGDQSVGTTLTINAIGSGTIGLASSVTASFTATGGTASGTDYTLPGSPAVTYASGTYASTATQNASVTIINDQIVETDETVDLGLSIVTNIGTQISVGGTTAHTLTITDDDTSVITLSPVLLSLNEGTGGGSTSFTFTATLSNPVQGGFSVAHSTTDGTATAGSDYTATSGNLAFSGVAGESHTITVPVTQDATNELDETFTVSLGAFSATTLGASLSTSQSPATATILNDDLVSLSIAATDASADENTAATGTWRITRNGVVGSTTVKLQVDATSSALAADWSQFGATFASLAPGSAGTAIITDGSSFVDITLTPLSDVHAEADETAILKITTDADYTIGTSQAAVTITANDFVVINGNDSGEGTLRQAVTNANSFASNDVITFATPQDVVLTSGELLIQNNGTLTIVGGGSTSISGNHTSRVLYINSVAQLTLSGLWLKNGHPGSDGGAIFNAGTLNIISSTLSGNAATAPLASGGAIFNNSGTLAVVNSTLSNNTATASGGAIHNSTGIVSVVNSTISTNAAGTQGGGLYNDNGSMSVDSATVTANTAATGGGGLYRTGGNLSLYNSIIAANTTTSGAPDLFAAAVSDDIHNFIGVNTGHPLVNGTHGDIIGTAATPANALLGPLANNGGPTLTHALQDGSPAINAGDSASLPADIYDVDGDANTSETLPSDQRGAAFPRVIGSIVDIGSYEAFAFRPAITAATFNEDTQNIGGLAVTPNTADGGLTTAFKITNIQNGTLYKNDGTTVITSGTFITLVEGAAGLKFTPSLNLNSPATTFGFDAQATVDGTDTGLRSGIATASITITPVNDAPTVVSPGLADQTILVTATRSIPLSPAFTDLDGDTLSFSVQTNSSPAKASAVINGTNVDILGIAAGNTDITILANDSHGGTVTDTFLISVGTPEPTPGVIVPPAGGYVVSQSTGTLNLAVPITNTTAAPVNGFRVTVDLSAYQAQYPGLRLANSSSAPGVTPAFIDYPYPVAVGAGVSFRLDFYAPRRVYPNPLNPVITITTLAVSQPSAAVGNGVPATIRRTTAGEIVLEWNSTPGAWYRVQFSNDMVSWYTSTIPIQAFANRTLWYDSGAPFTIAPPVGSRFYRVTAGPAPTP